MSFSSLFFIFIFLPLSLLLAFFLPGRGKKWILLAISVVFYAWGSLRGLLLLCLSIVFHYLTGLEMMRWKEEGNRFRPKSALIFGIAADVAVLGIYKYTSQSMPIGLSFYTFSAISYLVDIYREQAPAALNPLDTALYISFFPKVTSGPIVKYRDFEEQMDQIDVSANSLGEGMNLFLIGLFKKVLIADALGTAFQNVTSLPLMAGATAWLGMIFYSLQLYFDFSGYSDMAIGISRVFGFRFGKNFDYPYLSLNISEFWRRWHISLGAFFRDYVYIPLGGNRCSALRQVFNLLVVWVLTGIWHGNTLNFLVWGLYHGFFVIVERFVLKDHVERFPAVLRILVTDLLAFLGWVFFFSPSLQSAIAYFGKMFGADGVGFWNGTTTFLLREYFLLIVIAVLCATPAVKTLHDSYAYRRGGIYRTVSSVLYVLLFILCVAAMVSATYSSFLYFQF